ncbi:hypothetical protein BLNAU_7976 [Blattamonas nauphoetae]|uniref:Uncharacterized protein n=1 Tax=Blattamonas nauphoetae TaxID=2049346 RepID=A0ABQ9Y081_9EUKA|nr:hypothetical protein BLNAU_7976 [Blattamonas nauphoetae]
MKNSILPQGPCLFKVIFIALILQLVISLMNQQYYLDDRGGWIALLGLMSIIIASQELMVIYFGVAAVSVVIDIIRICMKTHWLSDSMGAFMGYTIAQIVLRLGTALCFLLVVRRTRELQL